MYPNIRLYSTRHQRALVRQVRLAARSEQEATQTHRGYLVANVFVLAVCVILGGGFHLQQRVHSGQYGLLQPREWFY